MNPKTFLKAYSIFYFSICLGLFLFGVYVMPEVGPVPLSGVLELVLFSLLIPLTASIGVFHHATGKKWLPEWFWLSFFILFIGNQVYGLLVSFRKNAGEYSDSFVVGSWLIQVLVCLPITIGLYLHWKTMYAEVRGTSESN